MVAIAAFFQVMSPGGSGFPKVVGSTPISDEKRRLLVGESALRHSCGLDVSEVNQCIQENLEPANIIPTEKMPLRGVC